MFSIYGISGPVFQGTLETLPRVAAVTRRVPVLAARRVDDQLEAGAEGLVPLPTATAGPSRQAVDAYFAGDLAALAAISWRTGGTDFQRSVWTALCAIPVGETVTYKQLAERIGRPSAVRAVGLANGANPVGVVVPCHRVIGSDGSLTGYGGGLERKRWLLTHEGASFRAAA